VATARARLRRRQLAWVIVVAAVLVPAFNLLTVGVAVRPAVQGLVDGVLRAWFRRLGFWTDMALSPWRCRSSS